MTRVEEESEKANLKLNMKKTKIMAPSPITSWQIEGEKVEMVTNLIFLGSKITADRVNLNDSCSLKGKLCPGMGEPGGLPSMGLHRVGHE